jgi:hypothetical protein
MSTKTRNSLLMSALAIAALAAITFWFTANASMRGDEPTEVVLVARTMAFYLPGNPTPNPTLAFARGERVRLVVKNEDPGMEHDFAASSLRLQSALLRSAGTQTALEFRLPDAAGTHEYTCTTHAALMRGRLEIH